METWLVGWLKKTTCLTAGHYILFLEIWLLISRIFKKKRNMCVTWEPDLCMTCLDWRLGVLIFEITIILFFCVVCRQNLSIWGNLTGGMFLRFLSMDNGQRMMGNTIFMTWWGWWEKGWFNGQLGLGVILGMIRPLQCFSHFWLAFEEEKG